MTAKKDLKKLVRERQAKTGEHYVTALAHVRAKGKRRVEAAECHDVSEWARPEGFVCRVVVSEALWKAQPTEPPGGRFAALFASLRSMLLALQGEAGADTLSDAILRGEPSNEIPNAVQEIVEARRFMAQVRSGVRGVSRNGRLVAFDGVVGVYLGAPHQTDGRGSLLWLRGLSEESASSRELGDELGTQFLLAGLGGLMAGSGR